MFARFAQACKILGSRLLENLLEDEAEDEEHVDHDEKDQMRWLELIWKEIKSYFFTAPFINTVDCFIFIFKWLTR